MFLERYIIEGVTPTDSELHPATKIIERVILYLEEKSLNIYKNFKKIETRKRNLNGFFFEIEALYRKKEKEIANGLRINFLLGKNKEGDDWELSASRVDITFMDKTISLKVIKEKIIPATELDEQALEKITGIVAL